MRCLLIAITLVLLMGSCGHRCHAGGLLYVEDLGIAAAPGGEEMDTSKPPLASYGTLYCKSHYVIWVWFDDKKHSVRRYDSDEYPMPGDMRKFLAWLETGAHDIKDLTDTRCVTSF